MPNNSINFSDGTDAVVNVSTSIDASGDDFFKAYSALYNLVENELAAAWKGDDYETFKAALNNEKHIYDSMRDVISEYATFLRNTANAHDARMQDSRDQVGQNCTFG